MRSSNKNKQKLQYSLFKDKIPIVDENGDPTGDYETGYSTPVILLANISAGRGTAEEEVFGKTLDFTRAISAVDKVAIDEFTRIWVDAEPKMNIDGTVDGESADYTVVSVAKSLNLLMIAIKKRNKDAGVKNA